MKKNLHILTLVLFWTMQINAQTPNLIWAKNYGDSDKAAFNQSVDCTLDNSGNLFVVGYTKWYPHGDYLILKYDISNGNLIWTKTFDGNPGDTVNNNDIAMGCVADGSGNLFVTGMSSNSIPNSDILTIKYNGSTGDTIWTRRYNGVANGNDAGLECAIDANGNLYVAGMCYNGSYTDFCILKYNASAGDLIWAKKYLSPFKNVGQAYGCSINGSDVFINGYIFNDKSYYLYTIKCNSNGDTLWTRINNEGLDSLRFIHSDCVADNSGNVYITGNCSDSINGVYGRIIKYDALGNIMWSTKYQNPPESPLNDAVYGCTLDMTGNLIVTGTTQGSDTFLNNFIIIRYNAATGDTIWTKRFKGRSGMDCVVDAHGYLYITGAPNYWGCLTLKYDNTGMAGLTKNNITLNNKVYPNPVNNSAIIEFNYNKGENCSLTIFDASGKIILKKDNITTSKIFLEKNNLANGIFFYQIRNLTDIIATGKLVIE